MIGASTRRKLIATLLLTLAAFSASCVYLRLLDFKRQLADFDRNFGVVTTNGLKIECRDPVLHDDDLRWLGALPEKIVLVSAKEKTEEWFVRWVKDTPAGASNKDTYDLVLRAGIKDELVTHIAIDERYFAFFPKELFLDLLRSAAGAKINRADKEAEIKSRGAEQELKAILPKVKTIDEMLGPPSRRTTAKGELIYLYHYRPVTTETDAKPIIATFTFDEATGSLKEFLCKLPKGIIRFKLTTTPETKAKKN